MALAVPDSVKMESTIAYPERNITECTLVVIVFSVNAGKVINTRRKVVEAWGVLPCMGYIGMCRCEGYGFQAVYSSIGYINQSVWV